MTTINQNNTEVITLLAGQKLTVVADAASSGTITRDADADGSVGKTRAAIAASETKTYGPYVFTEFFEINCASGSLTATTSRADFAEANSSVISGWADYSDDEYTEAEPFTVLADTLTALPNNAAVIRDSQKPDDIDEFYDGSVIKGRNGDAYEVKIRMKAKPTSGGTTTLEVKVDIGGAVGLVEDRLFTFPKGNGVERPIHMSFIAYTLDTWEANGGVVKVLANGACAFYDISYVFSRLHKAR